MNRAPTVPHRARHAAGACPVPVPRACLQGTPGTRHTLRDHGKRPGHPCGHALTPRLRLVRQNPARASRRRIAHVGGRRLYGVGVGCPALTRHAHEHDLEVVVVGR